MMQAADSYISPIVTADEAEDINRAFCDAIGDPRLFLFCHYQPIPDNPQEPTARYIPNILNLFVLACDSCFFLADVETNKFLRDLKGFSDAGKLPELNRALKNISRSVNDIRMLRACVAHNTSDGNGNYVAHQEGREWTFVHDGILTTQRSYYEAWVTSAIGKTQPETKTDYENLCAKLETIKKNLVSSINVFISCVKALSGEHKEALIQHWEDRIIEKYSEKPEKSSSRFFNQLVAVYFSIVAGKSTCTVRDIKAWIESSVGHVEESCVNRLKKQKHSLESDIKKCKLNLQLKVSEGNAESVKTLQGLLDQLEKDLSDCQNNLSKAQEELDKIIEESQKNDSITYFCSNFKDQLVKTLTLEHETINSLLPEVFLQAHINRTFPKSV